MNRPAPRLDVVPIVDPMPAALIRDPLAYLFAEHWRQRQFCRALADVAGAREAPPGVLRRMARFLGEDWAVHVADEEGGLFALLRETAEPEDDLDRVLGILTASHESERRLVATLNEGLAAAADARVGPAAIPGLGDAIMHFVAHARRHIALENAVVLPIARLRLKPAHLRRLSRAMEARRA